MNDTIELYEEYDEKGVCVKRLANGIPLPTDTEPSMQIFDPSKLKSITTKRYYTKEQVENIWPELKKKLPANQ